MKYLVKVGLVAALFTSKIYAGCWVEKVKVGGVTVAETRVCNPGNNPGNETRELIKKHINDSGEVWKKAYGHLPEHIRQSLNTRTLQFIGGALGGLEGAAFGYYLQQSIIMAEHQLIDLNRRKSEGSVPDWRLVYEEIFASISAYERAQTSGLCPADQVPSVDRDMVILRDSGSHCLQFVATDAQSAGKCIATFKKDVAELIASCN